ncbi:TRAP transporter, DctQ-like membrane protein [uncultured Desulfatiglans sp.]|nr:TRAP transporter, DctQ-like membrane protein [uncultured Desulfatiglans sp.]
MEHGESPCSIGRGGFMLSALMKWISRLEVSAIVLLFAFNLIILFVTVVYRYALNNSPTWPEEASRYVMIWIIYIGVSQSIEKNTEIRIDALQRFVNKKWFILFTEIFAVLVCLLISAILCFYAYSFTKILYQSSSIAASFPMPMYIIYAIIPVTTALMFVKYLSRLVSVFKN